MAPTSTEEPRTSRAIFVTTRWSVVLSAQQKNSALSVEALEILCRAYWYPLYAYVRCQGYGVPDAQDLTQEFFTRLLRKDYLQAVSREKGRFRTFLLTALKRFLANEWDRAHAQKRGGGRVPLSLDTSAAETRYQAESAGGLSADRIYERRWALTLIDQAVARLKDEFITAGKAREFAHLKETLTAERGAIPYGRIAAALEMSEGTARVAVHRLRKRFREIFRETIAQTVQNPSEVDEEMRHLMAVLSE